MEVEMSNADTVSNFLTYYQKHEFDSMHNCLDENVKFSDFAFDIKGKAVKAMWHWFCIEYSPRPKPVEVPDFEIVHSESDVVLARYRVSYPYGDKQRPVDYFITARFKILNGKIVEQEDVFNNISQFEFAKMAFGFPLQILALTPLLRPIVKKKAIEKLRKFMKDYRYEDIG
jgi:hypothetical protein